MRAPAEMAAIGTLSAAAQGLADVRRSRNLVSPISIWLLGIAPSGALKSAIDKLFTCIIKEFEAQKRDKLEPALEKNRSERDAWFAKRKGILGSIERAAKEPHKVKLSPEILNKELADHDAKEPARIPVPSVMIGDATIEALQRELSSAWPSAAILEDEGGAVLASHSFQKEKISHALGAINKIWANDPFKVQRIGRETIIVKNVRLTQSLMAQRCIIEELVSKNGGTSRDIGFLARFMFAQPKIAFGDREFVEVDIPELGPAHKRLRKLLRIELPWTEDGKGIKPPVLDFSPEGKAAWVDAYNSIQREEREFGEYADIRDISSKAGENIARLAALFHIFEMARKAKSRLITSSGPLILSIGIFTKPSALFSGAILSPEDREAEKVERWLAKHCRKNGGNSASRRDVQRGACGGRSSKKLDEALGILTQHGRARLIKSGNKTVIELRPEIIDGSDECAPF